MPTETETAPQPDDDRRDTDSADVSWTLTRDEDDLRQWWKADSNHVNASYTTLRLRRTPNYWQVTVKSVNDYGLVESSKTVIKTRRSREDAEEQATRHAHSYMADRPARRPFGGVPSVPGGTGRWELVDDGHREWAWAAGDHRIKVEHVGFSSTHAATTTRHDVVYRHTDRDDRVILSDAISLRAIRTAERCMRANPEARIGDDAVLASLRGVCGVGPKRAVDLQLLGITGRAELRRALRRDDTDHELEEALDRVLPSETRNRLCE